MIAAFDVGATNTRFGLFESRSSTTIVGYESWKTCTDKAAFIESIVAKVSGLDGLKAVAIGVPCLVSPDGRVSSNSNLPWRDWPLRDLLSARINTPIIIENDASVAALAEVNAISQLPELALYLTVGTGIGSSIVINGRLLPELSRSEAGLMVLDTPNGRMDFEHLTAGGAIVQEFGKRAEDLLESEWAVVAENIARGLLALIPFIRPEVIIFGGGVGSQFPKFRDSLDSILRAELPPVVKNPQMRCATYGEDSVLQGCRYLGGQ